MAEKKQRTPPAGELTDDPKARKVAEESKAKAEETKAKASDKKAKVDAKAKAADEKSKADAKADAEEQDGEAKPKPKRRRGAAETTTAKAKPKPRKRSPDAPPEDVEVRARARYVRCAPRKARLVVDHIRGKPVEDARALLRTTPRAASRDILKLLDSAVANAESNHELLADELVVHRVFVDEGPTLKRYQPRAQGRATPIHKRTSHMTIALRPAGVDGS